LDELAHFIYFFPPNFRIPLCTSTSTTKFSMFLIYFILFYLFILNYFARTREKNTSNLSTCNGKGGSEHVVPLFATCSCLRITKHTTKHPKERKGHISKYPSENEHVTKERGRKCGKVGGTTCAEVGAAHGHEHISISGYTWTRGHMVAWA
jgi:hypothetical protein